MADRRTPGKPLQLLDIEAEEDDDVIDSDDDDADDMDDDVEEAPSNDKKRKGGNKKASHPHCNINFVKDTDYYLLAGDTQKCWGTCTAEDPAPLVPTSRRDSCKPGDYLLVAGKTSS